MHPLSKCCFHILLHSKLYKQHSVHRLMTKTYRRILEHFQASSLLSWFQNINVSEIMFILNANKISQKFQHTLDWVLNHMQYLHLFPATAMCRWWRDRRKSSFKKISVTESMFTFIEAPKRTRVFGNRWSVLQFCSCLFWLPLSACSRRASQGRDTSAKCAPHLPAHARTPPDLLLPLAAATPAEQERESRPRWHGGAPGCTASPARHAAAAGGPPGAALDTPGGGGREPGGNRAAPAGRVLAPRPAREGASAAGRPLPCPALPRSEVPRFSVLSWIFFFFTVQAAKVLQVLLS